MERSKTVTVEFFGIPRQRAGRSELVVHAGAVAEVLAAVKQACKELSDLTSADGNVSPHYLLSVNGEAFVTNVKQPLEPGARLLLLSADAGG